MKRIYSKFLENYQNMKKIKMIKFQKNMIDSWIYIKNKIQKS